MGMQGQGLLLMALAPVSSSSRPGAGHPPSPRLQQAQRTEQVLTCMVVQQCSGHGASMCPLPACTSSTREAQLLQLLEASWAEG